MVSDFVLGVGGELFECDHVFDGGHDESVSSVGVHDAEGPQEGESEFLVSVEFHEFGHDAELGAGVSQGRVFVGGFAFEFFEHHGHASFACVSFEVEFDASDFSFEAFVDKSRGNVDVVGVHGFFSAAEFESVGGRHKGVIHGGF